MTRSAYIGELFDCHGHAVVHYPATPGSKRTGTSADAAPNPSRAATLRDAALDALKLYGPLTADEVADKLHESVLSIRPRMSELLALGKVKETSQRRLNASGKAATVWATA